ncbi:hypothetical protein OUZ56_025452 [Daphnia magna]|uniref:Uncharacterized protein n=1 Tax=Daphnia magna TaxID=35525 RepID=A0ABQ9ZJX1_9CRUS|nr:hypothetical protein OUZ56_025452 [Daphnia magna]
MKKLAGGTRGEGEEEQEADRVGDAPRQEEAPEKEAITLVAEPEENPAEGAERIEEERSRTSLLPPPGGLSGSTEIILHGVTRASRVLSIMPSEPVHQPGRP